MRKCEKNGGTWRPWRSARRGAPDLKLQRGLVGALVGAAPQGLDLRVPLGARCLARRPNPFPRKLDFSPSYSNSKPPLPSMVST